MPVNRKRLAEFFTKYARKRGITLGKKFAKEVENVLSRVQAPLRVTRSGKIVAATPAKPFAPPRMVTKALRNSVTVTETKTGCRVRVGKKYGMPLEFGKKLRGFPHRFFAVAAKILGIKLETKYG